MLSLLLAVAMGSTPGAMCSIVPFPGFRDSSTYLVGIARGDTVRADRGGTEPSSEAGHWGRGRPRDVYGQLVRVSRLGGTDSAIVEEGFRRAGVREIVVVPWDYGPDCTPVIWSRSFRFVDTTIAGMFTLRRRHRATIDGRPVFDAFMADLDPYPHGVFYQHGYRDTREANSPSALSADEYFDFYRALPTYSFAQTNPDAARAMLEAWERDHAAVAARFPARVTLERARRLIEYHKQKP